jgi:predicted Zn-dependent protease
MSEREIEGGLFSHEVPSGRAGARLRVQPDGVQAETAQGQTFQLAWGECQLELGGASGRMWFCSDAQRALTMFSEDPQLPAAMRAYAPPAVLRRLHELEDQARHKARRSVMAWTAFAVVCALLLLGGVLGLKYAANASVRLVPRSVDEKLGELALENMDLGGQRLNDAALSDGLRVISERLRAADAGRGFAPKLHVVDADIVNAFALPGGEVVVYTGLIRAAERPEQLAAVLAHELSHVARRHGMHRIAQTVGVVGTVQLLFGDVSGLSAAVLALLREGTINAYSRDQEREADSDAVASMARAGLDPRALAEFFALLQRREPGMPSALRWLGTHPDLGDRIAAVQRAAVALPTIEPRALALDWQVLQQRAGGASRKPSQP